jgi:hypothetical protein
VVEETEARDLLRKTYDIATQRLREKYHDEFVGYRQEAAKELGVEWEPRLTPEQRAKKEFEALIAEYPSLLEQVENKGD